jgi:hypothetical protein
MISLTVPITCVGYTLTEIAPLSLFILLTLIYLKITWDTLSHPEKTDEISELSLTFDFLPLIPA